MKTLLTSIFLFFVLLSQAQVVIFKTEATSFRYSRDSTTWEDWSTVRELEVNIIFDAGKETIVVYTQPEKKYVIMAILAEQALEDKNVLALGCVDNNGIKCVIHFVHMRNGSSYMSVQWNEIQVVYKILKI